MTAPTVCPTCKGDRQIQGTGYGPYVAWVRCPECCCDRCGTDVYTRGDGPQVCNDCAEDIGDDAYRRVIDP